MTNSPRKDQPPRSVQFEISTHRVDLLPLRRTVPPAPTIQREPKGFFGTQRRPEQSSADQRFIQPGIENTLRRNAEPTRNLRTHDLATHQRLLSDPDPSSSLVVAKERPWCHPICLNGQFHPLLNPRPFLYCSCHRTDVSHTTVVPNPRASDVNATEQTLTTLRQICLALPETSERASWGHPNFRAGTRTFTTFELVDGRPSIAFHLGATEPPTLLEHGRFFLTPYGRGHWVSLWADAAIDWAVVENLVRKSYRTVALKRMITAMDAEQQE